MTDFNFDIPVDRRGTNSVKWDSCVDCEELPLWVADMDFRTSPAIIEALRKRVDHGIFGYSFPNDEYYEAIDRWFKRRHNWSIPREQVIYTTGVVPATSAVIKGLTSPGDGVVIMTPVYTCFFSSIRNNECRVVESPLINTGKHYEIDFKNLEDRLAEPTSKILLLCNPHNPGGRVWTETELREIDRLCVKHNVIILSDEIHNEIVMPGYRYTPIANVATAPYVSMISPSKSFNTAGLHLANIVIPNEAFRAKINRAININETCDVGPFGITALIAAYEHGEPWLNAMIEYVHKNYIYLCERLAKFTDLKIMELEGSYLAWVDVSKLTEDVAGFAESLRYEGKVWIQAGTSYGKDGEGFIRFNLATSRSVLTEALNRFTDWIEQKYNR